MFSIRRTFSGDIRYVLSTSNIYIEICKLHKLGSCNFLIYLFLKIFLMWTIFRVFIEFVTILLLFYVLVFWPRSMWVLSSPTRDRTSIPCIGRQSLNHWTARKVPVIFSFNICNIRK